MRWRTDSDFSNLPRGRFLSNVAFNNQTILYFVMICASMGSQIIKHCRTAYAHTAHTPPKHVTHTTWLRTGTHPLRLPGADPHHVQLAAHRIHPGEGRHRCPAALLCPAHHLSGERLEVQPGLAPGGPAEAGGCVAPPTTTTSSTSSPPSEYLKTLSSARGGLGRAQDLHVIA